MISRRNFLKFVAAAGASSFGFGSYAFAIEPRLRLQVAHYRITPPGWSGSAKPLRIAALADIHACEPWMPASRIAAIADLTNDLRPDLVVLLGDYVTGIRRRFRTGLVSTGDWGDALARLSAPLGAYAVLGNHDWWTDAEAVRTTLSDRDIPVLENDAVAIEASDGRAFWLAGLGDQLAHPTGPGRYRGADDLPRTLAGIPEDGRPIVLLAHEPDIFAQVPDRVSLTLAGHTHGGQVALPFIGRPVVPSAYGQRYAYGHVVEAGRHLVVSGGLGCSMLPVRFGVPPEIVCIDVGGAAPTV